MHRSGILCSYARMPERLIAQGKDRIFLNLSGNDGMATAGSGDVLTGILLGVLAQHIPVPEAAYTGVYLHGAAGDRAAKKKGACRYAGKKISLKKQPLF